MDEVVTVYLICGDDFDNPKPVERVVAAGGPPERTAAIQLFLGVTPAEREAGWQSQFSSYTAHIVRGVELEGGVVILDLSPAFETAPNYATFSTGRTVLEQIRGTLLRMPQVEGVEFVIDGERWCGWNSGDCAEVPRPFLRR